MAETELPPYAMAPSPQSRALASAVRLGVRPFAGRVKGRSRSIRFWRTCLDLGARALRADPRVSVVPITGPVRGEWLLPPTPGTLEADEADPPVHADGAEASGAESSRDKTPGRPMAGGAEASGAVRGRAKAYGAESGRDEAPMAGGAVLYLHGGAYVICSPQTHRVITTRLAMDTGLPVLVSAYRLAPEHPFPAAFEDALAAYRLLLDRGVPASKITVVGDSAGGHLATALVGEACRTGLPSPAGVVLFSPWVDLTCELSLASDQARHDPYIDARVATRFGRMYVGAGDWTDPRVSLLSCPSADLPPFLIQVGGIEVLRAEAERLAEVLTAAGASCELQVWPGQMHVFQMFNRVLPEARAAMREASRFITGADKVRAMRGEHGKWQAA